MTQGMTRLFIDASVATEKTISNRVVPLASLHRRWGIQGMKALSKATFRFFNSSYLT
jgi:hypothetical protein